MKTLLKALTQELHQITSNVASIGGAVKTSVRSKKQINAHLIWAEVHSGYGAVAEFWITVIIVLAQVYFIRQMLSNKIII